MIKAAQKCRYWVAGLLLFSFLNILTFLPGSLHDADANIFPQSPTIFSVDDTEARSTILELVLESIAGLNDALPDSEKPDFSYHLYSIKFRGISWFLTTVNPAPVAASLHQNIVAKQVFCIDGPEQLPLLQHHNFIFRLTPF